MRTASGVLVAAAAVALAIGCDQETITLPEPGIAMTLGFGIAGLLAIHRRGHR